MNYTNRLLLTHIRKQTRPIKKIINLSVHDFEFPSDYEVVQLNPKSKKMNGKNILNEFSDNEFDFIYCQNPNGLFGMKYSTFSNISRIAKSGLIHNISPISVILNNMHINHIIWTNSQDQQNTLCIAEFNQKKMYSIDIEGWDRICLHKPYYLHDWYAWDSPINFGVKMYSVRDDFNTPGEYTRLVNNAIKQSAKNTANVIEIKPKPPSTQLESQYHSTSNKPKST